MMTKERVLSKEERSSYIFNVSWLKYVVRCGFPLWQVSQLASESRKETVSRTWPVIGHAPVPHSTPKQYYILTAPCDSTSSVVLLTRALLVGFASSVLTITGFAEVKLRSTIQHNWSEPVEKFQAPHHIALVSSSNFFLCYLLNFFCQLEYLPSQAGSLDCVWLKLLDVVWVFVRCFQQQSIDILQVNLKVSFH